MKYIGIYSQDIDLLKKGCKYLGLNIRIISLEGEKTSFHLPLTLFLKLSWNLFSSRHVRLQGPRLGRLGGPSAAAAIENIDIPTYDRLFLIWARKKLTYMSPPEYFKSPPGSNPSIRKSKTRLFIWIYNFTRRTILSKD